LLFLAFILANKLAYYYFSFSFVLSFSEITPVTMRVKRTAPEDEDEEYEQSEEHGDIVHRT